MPARATVAFAAYSVVAACGASNSTAIDAEPAANDGGTVDGGGSGGVDEGRLADDLALITGARTSSTPHWQTVQDLCADRFAALGFTVERHAYATGVNVIGVREGTELPLEQVLVSAHYDSVAACSGADDNASGVAGVFETARLLATTAHKRTLVVACWDEEEEGLIGSKAYAGRADAAGDEIVVSYVYEMIGYRSSEPDSQVLDPSLSQLYPAQAAEIEANQRRGDFILIVHDEGSTATVADFEAEAARAGLPTIALPVSAALIPLVGPLRRSDHAPFWDRGYAAVQLTDTADFRNPNYHCAGGDDAVGDIDLPFAALNVRATTYALGQALNR